ncbi:MAG TPA: rod shape-determining protein MreC [Candidatus Kryptonia bacterium]
MFKWLTEFFAVAKNYLVFALLLSFSFFLISTNSNTHTQGLQTLGLVTTSYLEAGVKSVLGYFSLSAKNNELQRENAQLVDMAARIRETVAENQQLRDMLKLKGLKPAPMIPANVVGRTSESGRYFVTLDVGSDDGVSVNDPVVTGRGLVGIVMAVSGNYSLVRTLLDSDSRIAARLVNAASDGIIVAGGFGDLSMKNVSRRYSVGENDIVETSTLSSLVPPGIVIGIVAKATDEAGNIFKEIEVQPAVDYTSLSAAFVMRYSRPAGAVGLESKALQKTK